MSINIEKYRAVLTAEDLSAFESDVNTVKGQTFSTFDEFWKSLASGCDDSEYVYYVMLAAEVSVEEKIEVIMGDDFRIDGLKYPSQKTFQDEMYATNYPDIKSIWQSKSDTLPDPPALIQVNMETKTLVDPPAKSALTLNESAQSIRDETLEIIKEVMGLPSYQTACDDFRIDGDREYLNAVIDQKLDIYHSLNSEEARDRARTCLRVIF